jgi:hypothetical protein
MLLRLPVVILIKNRNPYFIILDLIFRWMTLFQFLGNDWIKIKIRFHLACYWYICKFYFEPVFSRSFLKTAQYIFIELVFANPWVDLAGQYNPCR